MVDPDRQVALDHLKWISQLIGRLKVLKAPRRVRDEEVLRLEGKDVSNWEKSPRGIEDHEFEISLQVAEHDFAAIRAHKEVFLDPSVACVVLRVLLRVFLCQLVLALDHCAVVLHFEVFVAVLTQDQQRALSIQLTSRVE